MTSQPTEKGSLLQHDEVVCSLFEGHYHVGFAVLLNSLLRAGFSGLVWAGHRGEIPPWTSQLKELEPGLFELQNGARLKFEQLTSSLHFTNYKPNFMLDLIQRGIASKHLWYFDPDITVRCSWKFYQRWVGFGVSLVSDHMNGAMPPRHPLRCMWVEAAQQAGFGDPVSPQTRYFNGGFVALDVQHASFLERWRAFMEMVAHLGTDLGGFMKGSRENPFYASDQDVLNLTVMYGDEPVSAIGPEGMGFVPGGFTMYHSIGTPKPWEKRFVRLALEAKPPINADKHFLQCADGPIHPLESAKLKSMRMAIKIGSMIGRFYIRT
jgi:hypothetical protein